MGKDIQPQDFEDDTGNIIVETLSNLVESITGIAASDRKDWALSIGHLMQRHRGGGFLTTLNNEYNEYRDKGKIKEDYPRTEQSKVCLQELLDCLDKDSPDEIRFNVLKQIFLVAASEDESTRDDIMPQQYMKIARSLSDAEILILSACYQKAIEMKSQENITYTPPKWQKIIARDTGLIYQELVILHVERLREKSLMTSYSGDIKSKPYFGLSDLGYSLCKFIYAYEN